ncbi:MAG TPA: hypothetical protein VE954_38745 [Oligoflexus sp.]|uniref:hypothetical protein n=1 Tax=Oligoflexus sp. TaxID=1971216 RepID=UPI002D28C553|nr:hypothetical protein [Oligoflexus sp.]HYX39080.1 hypothetical protein [Oligoflexus sp.]
MKKVVMSVFAILCTSPVFARPPIDPNCGIVPTWQTCVSEPVLLGEGWKSLTGTGTDCAANNALPELVSKLKQSGVEPKGITVTCTYEQLGREIRTWELTL